MCIICEHQLYDEHRNAEAVPSYPCPDCGKFPSNDGGPCYHCFSVGNTIDECPECSSKPWSDDFLSAKAEIENRSGSPDDSLTRLKSLFSSASRIRTFKDRKQPSALRQKRVAKNNHL